MSGPTKEEVPARVAVLETQSLMNGARLFSPLRLRELVFKNRIFVSPMCQYSAQGSQGGSYEG